MKLIVNADDFGLTRSVTYGILEGFRNGVVRSTTLMTTSPHMEHAVSLAKEYPELGVGVHLVLTSGKPLTKGKSFTDQDGNFFTLADNKFSTYNLQEVEIELKAQIQKFLATGLQPTHFDAHHNMQSLSIFTPIFVKLAQTYNVPMRRLTRPYTNTEEFDDPNFIQKRIQEIKHTEAINKDFYGDNATVEAFCNMLEFLVHSGCKSAETYSHPGFVELELIAKSKYSMQRVKELDVLTSPLVMQKINVLGIELIHYGDL